MSLFFSAAIVVLVLLAAAAAWPAMYALWSRAVADTRDLNFWRLARRRGVTLAQVAGREGDLRHATSRCVGCQDAARCDTALDAGRDEEIAAFCPNRELIEDLAARHRPS